MLDCAPAVGESFSGTRDQCPNEDEAYGKHDRLGVLVIWAQQSGKAIWGEEDVWAG